jgi:adenylate kinase
MASRPRETVLLLGPTGSGKSPLGAMIAKRGLWGNPCVHFDFGARLRTVSASPMPSFGADDLAVIRHSLETGMLLENQHAPLALKIFDAFIEEKAGGGNGLVVLNGFPRHVGQAESLGDRVRVILVVVLECPPEVLGKRIHLDTGGDRAERADDSPSGIKKKLEIFGTRTMPLISHYEDLGAEILRLPVSAAMTADEMYSRLDRTDPLQTRRRASI